MATPNATDKEKPDKATTTTKEVRVKLDDDARDALDHMKSDFTRGIASVSDTTKALQTDVKRMEDQLERERESHRNRTDHLQKLHQTRIDRIENQLRNTGSQEYQKCATHLLIEKDGIEEYLDKKDFNDLVDQRRYRVNVGYALHPHVVQNTEKTFTTSGGLPCDAPLFSVEDARVCIRDFVPSRQESRGFSEFYECGPESELPEDCLAPGATKPEVSIEQTLNRNDLCKSAGKIQLTEEQLSWIPGLRAFIEVKLRLKLDRSEEWKFLNSTDAVQGYDGLIPSSQALVSTEVLPLDRLHDGKMQVWANGYTPTGYILNPLDWGGIATTKTLEGEYIYAEPGEPCGTGPQGNMPCLWGLPVCLSNFIPAGTFLVGDFAEAMINDGQLLGEFGTVLRLGYSGTGLEDNVLTLIAERVSNIDVPCGPAFVSGDLVST